MQTPQVFAALDDALAHLDRGFILVEGEPGAGKSTALTQYLQQRDDVSFGYFCFVPDEVSLGNERLGEAAFLQAVCTGLKNAFPDVDFPTPYAAQDVNLLNSWLAQLSANEQRVVFVVDGLDHVDRKSKQSLIARPLTAVLDGSLPTNVLVVLTSRYPQAAPPSIIEHIKQDPRRHIKMPRFNAEQVMEFLQLRGLLLKDTILDAVVNVSQGVPIYLEYLVGKLLKMHEYEQEKYLQSAPTLRNQKIDTFHEHIWLDVAATELSETILAILAVREAFTSPTVLRQLLRSIGLSVTLSAVNQALAKLSYLLRTSEAKGVSIRHSSLAEFVAKKTRQQRSEIVEAIIDWYEQDPDTDEAWRNRFRFFLEMEEYQKILDACHDCWFDQAWNAHRPLSEIQRNLSCAWQAAIQQNDLVAFTRIALLKQQTGLINNNLDNQQISISRCLLDIGCTDIALNYVWDGEKPLVSTLAFANFSRHYQQSTGRQLPEFILRAGLRVEQQPEGDIDNLSICYRALASIVDASALLEEIGILQWHTEEDHSHAIDTAPAETNLEYNIRLQLDVLKELANDKDIPSLNALLNNNELTPVLKNAAQAALAVAFAHINEIQEVRTTLAQLDWHQLPTTYMQWMCLALAPTGVPFPPVTATQLPPQLPPQLPMEFISERSLNPAFFTLFPQLHYFFFSNTTAQAWIDTALTKIPQPVRSIVSALADLAGLCVQQYRQHTRPQLAGFITISGKLDIPVRHFGKGNRVSSGEYYYHNDAHRFYSLLWSHAKAMLADDELLKLALSWQQKDSGQCCRRYPQAAHALAFTLSGIQTAAAQQANRELLQIVEQNARQDEDTHSLTAALLKTARAWGKCGFTAEAQRLWQEIAVVACGVGDRKDYQFTEIVNLIELAHQQDPGNTIPRLHDQLKLAYQLEDSGSSKQLAIAIEYLLAFIAKHWPGLAVSGLVHQEASIFRERAIHHLIRVLSQQQVDKQLLLAIVMTMSRWGNYRHFDDETLPAMTALFTAALNDKEDHISRQLYDAARQLFLVEKQRPAEVFHWATLWKTRGTAPADVIADIAAFKPTKPAAANSQSGFDEQKDLLEQELNALDSQDMAKLEAFLDAKSQQEMQENQMQQLNHANQDWLTAIKKLANNISREDQNEQLPTEQLIGEQLQPFYQDVATKLALPRAEAQQAITQLIPGLFTRLSQCLDTELDHHEIDKVFNLDGWLNEIIQPPRESYSYFVQRALEKQLPVWLKTSPYAQLAVWEDFCRKRCVSDTQAKALLTIAERLAQADRNKALDLLTEAIDSMSNLFFLDPELAERICLLAIKLDRESGIALVLNSFVKQFEDGPQIIVNYLPDVVTWLAEPMNSDAVALYQIWADYNQQLTAGLSNKPTDTNWLTACQDKSFDTAAIEYLLELLKYPKVDIRLLAVTALINTLRENATFIETVKACWVNCSDGQKEYIASCFDSLGRIAPGSARLWADWLVECAEQETHYNIRASVTSAIAAVAKEIAPATVQNAKALLAVPVIASINPTILHIPTANNTRLLPYLKWTIAKFTDVATEDSFEALVLSTLQTDYPNLEKGFEQEIAVHQKHNINSNFDTVEIVGAFGEATRSAINRTLMSMIQCHTANLDELNHHADLLRLRDPSDSLVTKAEPPADIIQMDPKQSDEAFLAFTDWDSICTTLSCATKPWQSLFEYTEQRTDSELKHTLSRVSKVRIEVFGAPRGTPVRVLERLVANPNLYHQRNLYRFELNALVAQERTGPVMPLVITNSRCFRGRQDTEIAASSGNLRDALSLQQCSDDPFGGNIAATQVIRSIEWQAAFDQDRRLHEPQSSGFLLQADRNTLLQLADRLKIDLWANITLERTTDKFKPEQQMQVLNVEFSDLIGNLKAQYFTYQDVH